MRATIAAMTKKSEVGEKIVFCCFVFFMMRSKVVVSTRPRNHRAVGTNFNILNELSIVTKRHSLLV